MAEKVTETGGWMDDLQSCPFCGGRSFIYRASRVFRDGLGHRIECDWECKAKTTWWHEKEQAIAAWNNRAAPQEETPCLN